MVVCKAYQHFPFQCHPNFTQNWDFRLENKSSGNPETTWHMGKTENLHMWSSFEDRQNVELPIWFICYIKYTQSSKSILCVYSCGYYRQIQILQKCHIC
jgi:hypothetical protein